MVQPMTAEEIRKDRARCAKIKLDGKITPARMKVLMALSNGLSNKEIASSLFLSEKTVKNHICALFIYFDAPSRCALVAKAFRLGLVQ